MGYNKIFEPNLFHHQILYQTINLVFLSIFHSACFKENRENDLHPNQIITNHLYLYLFLLWKKEDAEQLEKHQYYF